MSANARLGSVQAQVHVITGESRLIRTHMYGNLIQSEFSLDLKFAQFEGFLLDITFSYQAGGNMHSPKSANVHLFPVLPTVYHEGYVPGRKKRGQHLTGSDSFRL